MVNNLLMLGVASLSTSVAFLPATIKYNNKLNTLIFSTSLSFGLLCISLLNIY